MSHPSHRGHLLPSRLPGFTSSSPSSPFSTLPLPCLSFPLPLSLASLFFLFPFLVFPASPFPAPSSSPRFPFPSPLSFPSFPFLSSASSLPACPSSSSPSLPLPLLLLSLPCFGPGPYCVFLSCFSSLCATSFHLPFDLTLYLVLAVPRLWSPTSRNENEPSAVAKRTVYGCRLEEPLPIGLRRSSPSTQLAAHWQKRRHRLFIGSQHVAGRAAEKTLGAMSVSGTRTRHDTIRIE